jgi:hypothetical protein
VQRETCWARSRRPSCARVTGTVAAPKVGIEILRQHLL